MSTVHTGAETIQGRKLFKGGNYMRKYGIREIRIAGTFEQKRDFHLSRNIFRTERGFVLITQQNL